MKKKVEKSHSQKRLNLRVGSKWHIFQHLFFWFFVHNFLQNHQMNPKLATLKIQSAEIELFQATPKILFFLKMRFFNFFLSYMVQMYQNEIAPIFYYGKSPKTKEKDLKIPYLQPPD